MAAQAFIKHECPGRLRVSFPDCMHDEVFFQQMEDILKEKFPDVQVKTNPLTGTILLIEEDTTRGRLHHMLNQASSEGLIELVEIEAGNSELSVRFTKNMRLVSRFMDRLTRDLSGQMLDLRSLIGVTLLGFSFYQLHRDKVLPKALTLGLNAFALLTAQKFGARME